MSDDQGARRPATERKLRGTSCRSHLGACEERARMASENCFGQESLTIASLPSGVLSHIFEDLGPRDLASASCVCRAWRRLVALEAAANQVWRSFYCARWQLSGACWPSKPPLNGSGGSTTTKLISVPQSSSRGDAGGSGSSSGGDGAACAAEPPSSSSPSSTTATPSGSPEMRWQWAYGTKMLRLRSWSGRYSADQVVGHKMAVRAVRLLPACDLMATASLDRTVLLWDLRSGMPLGHSRPHGGTVRCLALDTGLLASGSSDCLVRVWQPRLGGGGSGRGGCDLASKPYILRAHSGPVSCLALDESLAATEVYAGDGADSYGGTLFSGSWDCTVRVWRQGTDGSDVGSGGDGDGDGGELSDSSGVGGGAAAAGGASSCEDRGGGRSSSHGGSRHRRAAVSGCAEDGGWSCAGVLQYNDWVYCCAVRGGNLLVAAGSEVVVTDAATGQAVRRFADVHDGAAVACLEGCRSGRLLFTASGDGLLLAHDLRMKQGSRVLWHHNAAVTGLAFEDPWLASASADGCIILQDSDQALSGRSSPQRELTSNCRALHCPAGQPALCLDLSDQWLAAGTESGVVRMWDFTGAASAAERAAAARAARIAAKTRSAAARQQQHQQRQQRQQQQRASKQSSHQIQIQQQRGRAQHQQHPYPHNHQYCHHRHIQRQQQQPPVEQSPPPQQQLPLEAEKADLARGEGRLPWGPLAVAATTRWDSAAAVVVAEAVASVEAIVQEQGGGGKRRGSGSDGAAAATTAAASDDLAPPRRGGGDSGGKGSGGGGSSDRWRHGCVRGHKLVRAPKPPPPPPVAPTFRYVGSGAGGVGGGGNGSDVGPFGMATISGHFGQRRMMQRQQQQQQRH